MSKHVRCNTVMQGCMLSLQVEAHCRLRGQRNNITALQSVYQDSSNVHLVTALCEPEQLLSHVVAQLPRRTYIHNQEHIA